MRHEQHHYEYYETLWNIVFLITDLWYLCSFMCTACGEPVVGTRLWIPCLWAKHSENRTWMTCGKPSFCATSQWDHLCCVGSWSSRSNNAPCSSDTVTRIGLLLICGGSRLHTGSENSEWRCFRRVEVSVGKFRHKLGQPLGCVFFPTPFLWYCGCVAWVIILVLGNPSGALPS